MYAPQKFRELFSRIANVPNKIRTTMAEKRVRELNTALATAIFWNDIDQVTRLLRAGANPNMRCDRSHPLDVAVRRAGSEVIDSLLLAGADPLEPHRWAGRELRLSYLAREWQRPQEIVAQIEQAERTAEQMHGSRALRSPQNACIGRARI